jgi:hypothetical protein
MALFFLVATNLHDKILKSAFVQANGTQIGSIGL